MQIVTKFTQDKFTNIGRKNISFSSVSQNNTTFDRSKQANISSQNSNDTTPKKESLFSFKNLTNWGAIILAPVLIATPIILNIRRGKPGKLADALNNQGKNLRYLSQVILEHEERTASKQTPNVIRDSVSWFGRFMNRLSSQRAELTNNMIYAFGTLVVMPLVILYSPFGSKKSSKEDKVFTVLRQPISFATLFPLQLTADKFFKSLIPKVAKLGHLGDDYNLAKIKDCTEKRIKETCEKIGSSLDEAKKYITENIKGLSGETVDKVLNGAIEKAFEKEVKGYKNSIETAAEGSIKRGEAKHNLAKFLKDKAKLVLEDGKISTEKLARIKNSEKYTKAIAKTIASELALLRCNAKIDSLKEICVVITNLITLPISCTLLNVAYGKFMKGLRERKEARIATLRKEVLNNASK